MATSARITLAVTTRGQFLVRFENARHNKTNAAIEACSPMQQKRRRDRVITGEGERNVLILASGKRAGGAAHGLGYNGKRAQQAVDDGAEGRQPLEQPCPFEAGVQRPGARVCPSGARTPAPV